MATQPQHGIPAKVLHKAHQLGVHNDCIISGNACTACAGNITLAFDFFYSHCTTEVELLGEIISDFMMEQRTLEEEDVD